MAALDLDLDHDHDHDLDLDRDRDLDCRSPRLLRQRRRRLDGFLHKQQRSQANCRGAGGRVRGY